MTKTGSFYRQAAHKRSAQDGEKRLEEAVRAGAGRDYGTAVQILEELISEYEGPAEAFLYLGRALHAQKNYSRALAALNDYITLKPRSPLGYFFAGRTCLVLKFYPRAVNLLEKALRRDKKNPLYMAMLGMACLKARHSQAAVDMFQKAVETAPRSKRIYRAYLNALFIRAIRVCRNEDYGLGIQMLRFVLENSAEASGTSVDSTLVRLELGRACRKLGLLDEAVEHYTRALEFAPGDLRIRWYRASILMELGRNEEALEDISVLKSQGAELPELSWNSLLVDNFMIRSFVETGQWRRAADACRDWLKHREPDPQIHAIYAEAQRNLRDYESAENHLRRAIALDDKSLQLWYALALTAWECRDLSTLKNVLYRAQRLGGDRELLSRFSILYESESSRDIPRIITLLQKSIHTMGPEPELMNALGKAYLKVGMFSAALGWFEKVLTLEKDHEEAYLGIIAAREALFGDGGKAAPLEAAYRTYLEKWPDNLSIRRDEALFLVRICEYEAAARKLETLLAWNPANPGLRRVLAYSYRKAGRYRAAAVYLKALLKEKPRDVRLLLEYSGCIERAGGSGYAKVILEKALPYFKESPEIPTALGLLAWKEGHLERAFEMLQEAVSRNQNDPRPYRWMIQIARRKGDTEGVARYERALRRIQEGNSKPAGKARKSRPKGQLKPKNL